MDMLPRTRALGLVAVIGMVEFALACTDVKAAGERERKVEFHVFQKTEPMVVWKVTVGDQVVQLGRYSKPSGQPADPITPFRANDDWVQNLTVYLLNRTNRQIAYVYLVLDFRANEAANRSGAVLVHLGHIPVARANGVAIRQPSDAQPIQFGPGETFALHPRDYLGQMLTGGGPAPALSAMTVMTVNPQNLFLADGMEWNAGYHAYDPQTSSWTRLGRDFFPGDIDAIWPGGPGWVNPR
jgi:hypothetical protein